MAVPVAGAEERAAGPAPPQGFAGAAGRWGGCTQPGFRRDSQRAGLQQNQSVVQGSSSLARWAALIDTQSVPIDTQHAGTVGIWDSVNTLLPILSG